MNNLIPHLVQVLITLGVGLPAFLGGMFARRKSAADVEVTLSSEARAWADSFASGARTATEAARNAIEQARLACEAATAASARARGAEGQVRACQERIDFLEDYVRQLRAAIRGLGGDPPPLPAWSEDVAG